ncbi:MAG: hypothetical protein ACM3Q4_03800 [Acidobacteriota bacterium]
MYEQLLLKSERCIEQEPARQLTISSLWEKVKVLAAKDRFVIPDTKTDFECLLEGDKRFSFTNLNAAEDEHDERDILEKEFPDLDEIEGLGFDREQTVTLSRFLRQEEEDAAEDEAFAPRPFKKDDEPSDGIALVASKQSTQPRPKKAASKKSSTKRKQ